MVLQREWGGFCSGAVKNCDGRGFKPRSIMIVREDGHMSGAEKRCTA